MFRTNVKPGGHAGLSSPMPACRQQPERPTAGKKQLTLFRRLFFSKAALVEQSSSFLLPLWARLPNFEENKKRRAWTIFSHWADPLSKRCYPQKQGKSNLKTTLRFDSEVKAWLLPYKQSSSYDGAQQLLGNTMDLEKATYDPDPKFWGPNPPLIVRTNCSCLQHPTVTWPHFTFLLETGVYYQFLTGKKNPQVFA